MGGICYCEKSACHVIYLEKLATSLSNTLKLEVSHVCFCKYVVFFCLSALLKRRTCGIDEIGNFDEISSN